MGRVSMSDNRHSVNLEVPAGPARGLARTSSVQASTPLCTHAYRQARMHVPRARMHNGEHVCVCLVHACTTASTYACASCTHAQRRTPELLNRRIREFRCAPLHAFISASSLIMDDAGTIIFLLHTVKSVDESIISTTDMILEVASAIIVAPRITISIRDTIVGGTLTVIGPLETVISTMETVIGAMEIIISGGT